MVEEADRIFEESTNPVTLAQRQGVSATGFDGLQGDFWPEEEGSEEFLLALRTWREDELYMPRNW